MKILERCPRTSYPESYKKKLFSSYQPHSSGKSRQKPISQPGTSCAAVSNPRHHGHVELRPGKRVCALMNLSRNPWIRYEHENVLNHLRTSMILCQTRVSLPWLEKAGRKVSFLCSWKKTQQAKKKEVKNLAWIFSIMHINLLIVIVSYLIC